MNELQTENVVCRVRTANPVRSNDRFMAYKKAWYKTIRLIKILWLGLLWLGTY